MSDDGLGEIFHFETTLNEPVNQSAAIAGKRTSIGFSEDHISKIADIVTNTLQLYQLDYTGSLVMQLHTLITFV